MKRFHIHIRVENLPANIAFYSELFGCPPARMESDSAKLMLDDPRINFAISTRGQTPSIDHLGIQVDSANDLEHLNQRLLAAAAPVKAQQRAACCYAESDKYWTVDPQGIAWEAFHSLSAIPVFGSDIENPVKAPSTCCSSSNRDQTA